MSNFIRITFTAILLSLSLSASSQYYDGFLDFIGKVGVEPGKDMAGIIGGEAGIGKYVSLGVGFKFLLTLEEHPSPFGSTGAIARAVERPGYYLRADIHGFHILNLERSDILAGYNYMNGTSGVHSEYRYFLNEFLAVYGRAIYHFDKPLRGSLSEEVLSTQFRAEVGLIFKTVSGDSYKVDW